MVSKYANIEILDSFDSNSIIKVVSLPIKVMCRNFDTNESEIKLLNKLSSENNFFWRRHDCQWSYYIKLSELNIYFPNTNIEKEKIYNFFSDNYNEIRNSSSNQKVEILKKHKYKLMELYNDSQRDEGEIYKELICTSSDTIMINKVIFEELSKKDIKIKDTSMVDISLETIELVELLSKLLVKISGNYKVFIELINKSNGTTVKHMIRTHILSVCFLNYYNLLIEEGYISRIRVKFSKVYKESYKKILPRIDNLQLENIFKGGMRKVEDSSMNQIALGFLLHDLGKESDIDYFESELGYDKNRIVAHVTNGFNSLVLNETYSPTVSAIAGFHHEYYGHIDGYGPLRDYLKSNLTNRKQIDYCISYNLNDIYNYDTMIYFPAKLLELVDVYDALTDPERIYKKQFTPNEAITYMKSNFLGDDIKLDPILFDMFKQFLVTNGVLDENMG